MRSFQGKAEVIWSSFFPPLLDIFPACRRSWRIVWLLVSMSACRADVYLLCQPEERWNPYDKPTPLPPLLSSEPVQIQPPLGPHHSFCVSPLTHLGVLGNALHLLEWMATDPRIFTWVRRCLSPGPLSRGPPSVLGAGTTACCPGSKVTSGTAGSRTAPVRNASSSSSGSASWRRRWRCAGSRPTRVWRASSRSRSGSCPGSAWPQVVRGTREPRRGQTSWSSGGAAQNRRPRHKHAQVNKANHRLECIFLSS